MNEGDILLLYGNVLKIIECRPKDELVCVQYAEENEPSWIDRRRLKEAEVVMRDDAIQILFALHRSIHLRLNRINKV